MVIRAFEIASCTIRDLEIDADYHVLLPTRLFLRDKGARTVAYLPSPLLARRCLAVKVRIAQFTAWIQIWVHRVAR